MTSVEEAFENTSEMMRKAGFELHEKPQVVVDTRLPFMGYTTSLEDRKENVIVVSGFAAKSGMLEGLLIHEMSHIYRTTTRHPSHNQEIISSVIGPLIEKGLNKDYQVQALHAVVNHIEDLYADDISFKVFAKNENKLVPPSQLTRFFQDWVKAEPVLSNRGERAKWANASLMLGNVFALSNMERHGIPDIDGMAAERNQRFLSRINAEAGASFEYFRKAMVTLREDITEVEFRNFLGEYTVGFLQLVKTL